MALVDAARELGERRMSRVDIFRMVKRRVKAAKLGDAANCHTLRASGITASLLNGGTLERAQAIAGHESPRTTQLYDRTGRRHHSRGHRGDKGLTRGAGLAVDRLRVSWPAVVRVGGGADRLDAIRCFLRLGVD